MATLIHQDTLNNTSDYPNTFVRTNAFPLERYSIFDTLTGAEKYAKKNPIAYIGQQLVVATSTTATPSSFIISGGGNLVRIPDIYDLTSASDSLTADLSEHTSTSATTDTFGHVKLSNNEVLSNYGTIATNDKGQLVSPIATASTYGVVKACSNINQDGASPQHVIGLDSSGCVVLNISKNHSGFNIVGENALGSTGQQTILKVNTGTHPNSSTYHPTSGESSTVITNNNGQLAVYPASASHYGVVKIGENLSSTDYSVVPNCSSVNAAITSLSGTVNNKFVTHDNILGGISTQTIFGYDSFSDTTTNNTIYLDDDHLVVHSGGNEISFPKKAGTVALTTDITAPSQATKSGYGTVKISSTLTETTDNIVPSISQVNTLLEDKANTAQVLRDTREVAQNASDGIANLFGWSGTLRDLNVGFERVGISTLSLKKRTGSAPSNTVYARIVHIGSSGTVEMLFQSKNSVSWGNVAAGAVVTYEMEHIKGRVYPTNTERIVLYFVSSKTDADGISNSNVGLQTESGKGGAIIAAQSSTTSLPGGQGGYRPVIGLTYYNAIDNLESRLIESIETKLDKSHEDKIATQLEYGHVKLGTQYTIDTADDNFGVIGKTSNGQLAYRMDSVPTSGSRLPVKSGGVYQALSSYVPLSGGTINGTLTIDTSDVIDKAPLVLKVHTQQSDPSRPLIVVRDETGSEFVTMKVKREEEAAAYEGQLLLECEAFTVYKLSTQTGVMGPAGVAPTTGTWSDAGGAWKLDLKKGELAITDNGWDSDENATPKATTFLKFIDILKSSDVPSWAKQETKPTYTASEVGAQPAGKYVTYDTTSTDGSENLVSSSAIKTYIDSIVGDIKSALEAL